MISTGELKLRIENNKQKIEELEIKKNTLTDKYIKGMSPQGIKSGTSYKDYDTIHGSRAELRIEDLYNKIKFIDKEIERIQVQLELDEKILKNRLEEVNINEYLAALTDNKDKVKFLRQVCGFTQQAVADKIHLSLRQVQNIEVKIKKNII